MKKISFKKIILYIIDKIRSSIRSLIQYLINHKVAIQRFFKLLIYCALLFGLCFQTRRFYTKLKITPEIFTKENFVKGREVPFPAVTFCPNYLVESQKKQIFIKYSELIDQRSSSADSNPSNTLNQNEESTAFNRRNRTEEKTTPKPKIKPRRRPTAQDASNLYNEAKNLVCYGKKSTDFNITENYDDLADIIQILSPKFSYALKFAQFSNELLNEDNFILTYTEFGICYTFNSLGHNHIIKDEVITSLNIKESTLNTINWNLRHGYHMTSESVYPARASPFQKLEFDLIDHENEDYCETDLKNATIRFHLPNELPTFLSFSIEKEVLENKYLRISAEVKYIDESLKEFSAKQRGCYYEGEKQLSIFKSYTKANCEYECMVNFTDYEYGCVPFFFYHTEDMEVCTNASILDQNYIIDNWPEVYYTQQENNHLLPVYPCDCMEPCTQVNYQIIKELSEGSRTSESEFRITFTDPQISNITTYITYQLENFTFDVAGLFGIFLGSSIASLFLIPIKAYFYVRNFSEKFYLRLQRKKKIPSEPETIETSHEIVIDVPDEVKKDRRHSNMSEISEKIFILSHRNAAFVPVLTKKHLDI